MTPPTIGRPVLVLAEIAGRRDDDDARADGALDGLRHRVIRGTIRSPAGPSEMLMTRILNSSLWRMIQSIALMTSET